MEFFFVMGAATVGVGLALRRMMDWLGGNSTSLNEMPKKRKSPAEERRRRRFLLSGALELREQMFKEFQRIAEKQELDQRRQERADVFFNKKESPFSSGGGKAFGHENTPSRPNDIYWRGNKAVVRLEPKP